ncbi:MAG: hypothetical protein ACYDEB_10780 [Dehalococcoidia bacterium]
MTFPPPPDVVITELRPLLDWLLRGLEVGTEHANDYDEHYEFVHDAHLYAYHVRHSLRNEFIRLGDDAPLGLSVRTLPLCGVEVYNAQFRVRVLKASYKLNTESRTQEIAVPDARGSRARREFFYQPSMDVDDGAMSLDVARLLKLVLLWDCDENGRITLVSLAAPKTWDESNNRVNLHWRAGIYPSDVVAYDTDEAIQDVDEAAGILDDFDLRQRPDDEEEATTG